MGTATPGGIKIAESKSGSTGTEQKTRKAHKNNPVLKEKYFKEIIIVVVKIVGFLQINPLEIEIKTETEDAEMTLCIPESDT